MAYNPIYNLIELVILCSCMFISTFFIGYLPQVLSFNRKRMNLISIYGAGLLIGAALIIIIPEGMMVLISAMSKVQR